MIQLQTKLFVADNTGAKKIMCIQILGGKQKFARAGNIIVGVVKEGLSNGLAKRGSVVRALVIRTKHRCRRLNGNFVKFNDNAAVIINSESAPKGSRIFGPVASKVREKGFTKVISLANEIL